MTNRKDTLNQICILRMQKDLKKLHRKQDHSRLLQLSVTDLSSVLL